MQKPFMMLLALVTLCNAGGAQQPTVTPSQQQAVVPQLTVSPATDNSLPVGTAVKLKLETPISTLTSRIGDTFSGRVTEDVTLEGKTVIPVGAGIQGTIVHVTDPRRFKGRPMVELRPEQVTLPNGEKYTIAAVVVDTEHINGTKVDEEGHIHGKGVTHKEKLEMGAGAGAGAIAGGLIEKSAKGVLLGSVIGGGSAVVYWLTRRHETNIPAGSEIIMELSRPMTMAQSAD